MMLQLAHRQHSYVCMSTCDMLMQCLCCGCYSNEVMPRLFGCPGCNMCVQVKISLKKKADSVKIVISLFYYITEF